MEKGARGVNKFRFCRGLIASRIGGNTIFLYLQHFLCDISLISISSNRLVSQYDLLTYAYKDITKVISRGRDRLVEIESNRQLS